jgi:hypothetical protein
MKVADLVRAWGAGLAVAVLTLAVVVGIPALRTFAPLQLLVPCLGAYAAGRLTADAEPAAPPGSATQGSAVGRYLAAAVPPGALPVLVGGWLAADAAVGDGGTGILLAGIALGLLAALAGAALALRRPRVNAR